MSIFPANDLVLDVGRAADPVRKAGAITRLERLSLPSGVPASISGASLMPPVARSNPTNFQVSKSNQSMPTSASPERQDAHVTAFRKFEAFILQTWLEILLPKAGFCAYGHDQASGIWRSLMAEQLGEQLSKNDSLGIERLARHGVDNNDGESFINRIDFVSSRDKS